MKHLLKLEDWSTDEIINTLNLADHDLNMSRNTALSTKFLPAKHSV